MGSEVDVVSAVAVQLDGSGKNCVGQADHEHADLGSVGRNDVPPLDDHLDGIEWRFGAGENRNRRAVPPQGGGGVEE